MNIRATDFISCSTLDRGGNISFIVQDYPIFPSVVFRRALELLYYMSVMTVYGQRLGGGLAESWCTRGVNCQWQLVSGLCMLILLVLFQGCATNYRGRYYRFSSEQLVHGSCDIPQSYQSKEQDFWEHAFSGTMTESIPSDTEPTQEIDEAELADTFVVLNNERAIDSHEVKGEVYSGTDADIKYDWYGKSDAARTLDGWYLTIVTIPGLHPGVRVVVSVVYYYARPYMIRAMDRILDYLSKINTEHFFSFSNLTG